MSDTTAKSLDAISACEMPLCGRTGSIGGLRTPPPSPGKSRASPEHHQNRIQLPRFLRRNLEMQPPLFLGPQHPNEKTSESLTAQENEHSSLHPASSPFRAVQHMREPFPLVLPASPAPSIQSAETPTPQALRAVPTSYQNLRAFQSNQGNVNSTPNPLALLPSPVFSELQIGQISDSYFLSRDAQESRILGSELINERVPYEEHRIIAEYCDEVQTQSSKRSFQDASEKPQPPVTESMHRPSRRRDVGMVCAPTSFPRWQRGPRRDRSRTCSSEADWLAGKMSENIMLEEWLETVEAPRPGELQQETSCAAYQEHNDGHQVVSCQHWWIAFVSLTAIQMYATRLKGVGRPKIVNISRPVSLCTTSTSILELGSIQDEPSTPLQSCPEVSAFSPCSPETPSDPGRGRIAPTRSLTFRSARPAPSLQSLRPAPLTPRRCERRAPMTPQKSSSVHSRSMLDSLRPSPNESQATFASSTNFSTFTLISPMRTPPPVLSPVSEAAAWSRCQELEDILEAVSMAIDPFLDMTLYLDSPAVLVLRNPEAMDELTIGTLQRIFPQTAWLPLSALSALLVVDLYLSGLEPISGADCESLYSGPRHKYSASRLAARSNECLHEIPTKARATLGIHLPNVTQVQVHERALKKRAETVAVCVRVQGQKMLHAICARYDEVLWRTLKVLVDTLERSRT